MSISYPNLAFWTISQTRRVVAVVEDVPGFGKSESVRAFLRRIGYECFTFEGSLHEPTDLGFPYPKDVTITRQDGTVEHYKVMSQLIPEFLFDAMRNPKTGVFWDELRSIPEQMQTSMMGPLNERRIGAYYFPKEVIMMAAANPVAYAANGHEFAIPLVTRICHLPWERDWDSWEIGMLNGGRFPEPKFEPLPEDWERFIMPAAGRIAAFTRRMPELRDTTPKQDDPDFAVKSVKPCANQRSWLNAAICRAACMAVDADPLVQLQAIRGCVGEEVAQQFAGWEAQLDLPDPEPILQAATAAVAEGRDPEIDLPVRSDMAMALLSGLIDRAVNHEREGELPAKARWEGCAGLLNVICRTGSFEMVVATASPLMGNVPPSANVPAELLERLFPVLKRCGLMGA